jgi:hypothetical protein
MAGAERVSQREKPRATVRLGVAILTFITLVLACMLATYLEFQLRSAHMAMSNLPLVVLLPFVFWLLGNSVMKRFAPGMSLSTVELRVIFSALWAGGAFAGYNWAPNGWGRWLRPGTMLHPRIGGLI